MTTIPTTLGPIYADDQGSVSQPVALLWPSLFTDHQMWRDQVPILRESGWRTIVIDPPGHGRSVGPGRDFTMDECAEAALQVLDGLGIRTPVVYLGTSWGGFVGPRLALRAPDRVKGMVLFNTSAERPTFFERLRTALLTKLLSIPAFDKMIDGMVVSLMLRPETLRERPELGPWMVKKFRSWDRRSFIITVRSVLGKRGPVIDQLAGVKTPVLVVSGAEDKLLPSIHSRRMVERLPNGRHVEVAGAAHLTPLEATQAANSLVLEFVKTLPGS